MPSDYDDRWTGVSIPEIEWHFHARLLERYDIILNPGEFSRMLKLIKEDRAPVVHRNPPSRIVAFRRNFDSKLIFVAVMGVRPLTALPPTRQLHRSWVRLSKELRSGASFFSDHYI